MDFDTHFKAVMRPQDLKAKTLAQKCIVLYILKTNAPKRWTTQMEAQWKTLLTEMKVILSQVPAEFTEMEDRLDFWYFTKLTGFGDAYQPDPKIVRALMRTKWVRVNRSPKMAVFFYVYFRILETCDPKNYRDTMNQCFSILEKQCQANPLCYVYFLTHVIFYDLQFQVCQTLKLSTRHALQNLERFGLQHMVQLTRDVIAEILMCYKFCPTVPVPKPFQSKFEMLMNETPISPHEHSVLACLACPFG